MRLRLSEEACRQVASRIILDYGIRSDPTWYDVEVNAVSLFGLLPDAESISAVRRLVNGATICVLFEGDEALFGEHE